MEHRVNNQNGLQFILAGDSYMTFRNNKTGNRYTYHVKKSKEHDMHFVSVMYGKDNNSQYLYVGIIASNLFRLTKGSKMDESDVRFKVFAYVFKRLLRGSLPLNIEIWHEGKCGRCGRKLTVPESIETGIGPECALRMGIVMPKTMRKQGIKNTGNPVVMKQGELFNQN